MEKEPTATGTRRRLLPLPVGKSIWEEVAEHCYCVDKTLLIRALLATRAGTVLFTRPRRFGKYFGFTEDEVEEMARYYGREDKLPEIRSWYDGYVFGGREMYNPWSVLYYFDAGCVAKPYWLDTSSNDIIAELVETLPFDMAKTLELLMKDKSAIVPMTSELGPYQYIRDTPQTLYALLVSAGYLKPKGDIVNERCAVEIPNREVRHVFLKDILYKLRKASRSSEAENEVSEMSNRRTTCNCSPTYNH